MIYLAALTFAQLSLTEMDGAPATIETRVAPATAVVFVSTVCPVSNEYEERYQRLFRDFSRRGVRFVFVYANRTETATEVAAHAAGLRHPLPVYRDQSGSAVESLGPEFTPTAVVIDRSGAVRYRGRIDDSVNPARVKDRSLEKALKAVLAGRAVAIPETKAFG